MWKKKRKTLSIDNICLLNYIIKKYLNLEEDFIQAYEDKIDAVQNLLKPNSNDPRRLSILILAKDLFYYLDKQEREKWLNKIVDEEVRTSFSDFCGDFK